jgi:hypothetical protein
VTDSVWNEHSRLNPKFHQYSMQSTKFKKNGERDLEKCKDDERESQYQSLLSVVSNGRQEKEQRDKNRKLEREIVRDISTVNYRCLDLNESRLEAASRLFGRFKALRILRPRGLR